MRDNFPACLAEVLRHEGGWSDDPRDAGGATMRGVTLATYRRWRPGATKDDLRRITDAELARIYRSGYWDAVKGDDLPAGLDLIAFDAAVNSGPARGARWLQQALSVTADGKIGSQTIAAAQAAHRPAVIERALSIRLAFLRAAKNTKTGAMLWPTYGRGWTRRVESVRDVANAMATVTRPTPKPQPVAGIPPAILIAAVIMAVAAIFIFA